MRRRRITAVLGVCLVVLAAVLILAFVVPTFHATPGVAPENFARLRKGMTEREVMAILGEPSLHSETEESYAMSWYNKDYVNGGPKSCFIGITFSGRRARPAGAAPRTASGWSTQSPYENLVIDTGSMRFVDSDGKFMDVKLGEQLPRPPKSLFAKFLDWFKSPPATTPPRPPPTFPRARPAQ